MDLYSSVYSLLPSTEPELRNFSNAVVPGRNLQLTELSNVMPARLAPDPDVKQILDELRSLKEVHLQMFTALTEEVLSLQNEVRQLRTLRTVKSNSNKLPTLPFKSIVELTEFDKILVNDADLRAQLKNVVLRMGGTDLKSFLRLSLKGVMVDDVSRIITWCGTNNKPSFQSFNIFNIISDAAHIKYSTASTYGINKFIQQHFHHAQDRVNKKQKQKNK